MVQGRKPNPAIRKRIARLRADGHSGAEIARRMGVSHQAIYPILNGTALRRGAAVCCSCRATILSAQASKQLRGLLCLDCLARSPAAPLGQRLSSLRIIAEMTQAQLSEATGISSSYISSLEIGQHRPSVKTRVRLLEFLEAVVAKPSKP